MQTSAAPPSRRFELDAAALHGTAWFRGAAALLSALASVWLWLVADAFVPRAVAVAGIVFAVLWGRAQLRQLRSAAHAPHYLELGADVLVIASDAPLRRIALADVRSVELDDDRLQVVLQLADGTSQRIDAQYRGLGLRELASLVHEAAERARTGARS